MFCDKSFGTHGAQIPESTTTDETELRIIGQDPGPGTGLWKPDSSTYVFDRNLRSSDTHVPGCIGDQRSHCQWANVSVRPGEVWAMRFPYASNGSSFLRLSLGLAEAGGNLDLSRFDIAISQKVGDFNVPSACSSFEVSVRNFTLVDDEEGTHQLGDNFCRLERNTMYYVNVRPAAGTASASQCGRDNQSLCKFRIQQTMPSSVFADSGVNQHRTESPSSNDLQDSPQNNSQSTGARRGFRPRFDWSTALNLDQTNTNQDQSHEEPPSDRTPTPESTTTGQTELRVIGQDPGPGTGLWRPDSSTYVFDRTRRGSDTMLPGCIPPNEQPHCQWANVSVRPGEVWAMRLPFASNDSSFLSLGIALAEAGANLDLSRFDVAISKEIGNFNVDAKCSDFNVSKVNFTIVDNVAGQTRWPSCRLERNTMYYVNVRPAAGTASASQCGRDNKSLCKYRIQQFMPSRAFAD